MITIEPPGSFQTHNKVSLTRFLNRARAAIGLPGSVSVLLSTDAELKRLNRQFRAKNKPTDVLSFPADPIPGLPAAQQHAGDLAVSLETACRQAAEHGHTLSAELRILLLHGLLHLSGLDHETDKGEMAARESELRSRFRLPDTLIARTLMPPTTSSRPIAPKTPSSRPKRGAVQRPGSPASLLAGVQRSPHSVPASKQISGTPKTTHNSKLSTGNRQQTTKQRGPR